MSWVGLAAIAISLASIALTVLNIRTAAKAERERAEARSRREIREPAPVDEGTTEQTEESMTELGNDE